MNLVLIGYRGSGKTVVGGALAGRLGWSLIDTDPLIETEAGATIRSIYAEQGEDAFRDMEARVVRAVAQRDRYIISTGGGVVLRDENVEALRRNGRVVWLKAPSEVLWGRILADVQRRHSRPPLNVDNGLSQIRDALAQRDPLYARAADLIIETADQTLNQIVESLAAYVASMRPA